MKRLVSVLLAMSALLLGAAKCEEHDTHPSAPRVPDVRDRQPANPGPTVPDPAAGDPKPHNRQLVTVRAGSVEPGLLPAEVNVTITGGGHEGPAEVHDILTSGDPWVYQIWYDDKAPGDLNISVQLTPATVGSQAGFCAIEGGKAGNFGPRKVNGRRDVRCYLTVHRG